MHSLFTMLVKRHWYASMCYKTTLQNRYVDWWVSFYRCNKTYTFAYFGLDQHVIVLQTILLHRNVTWKLIKGRESPSVVLSGRQTVHDALSICHRGGWLNCCRPALRCVIKSNDFPLQRGPRSQPGALPFRYTGLRSAYMYHLSLHKMQHCSDQ